MRIQVGSYYTAISKLSKVAFLSFWVKDEKDRTFWERRIRNNNIRLVKTTCFFVLLLVVASMFSVSRAETIKEQKQQLQVTYTNPAIHYYQRAYFWHMRGVNYERPARCGICFSCLPRM